MEVVFTKDPEAVLDYAMDWSSWLSSAEVISTYLVTADSSLITISTHAKSSGVVTAWLSGGVAGCNYKVSIKIDTNMSRTDERSFMVKIKER